MPKSTIWRRHAKSKHGRTGAILWGLVPMLVKSGDSDGTVPTQSAKWGKYLGSYPADHYAIIGQGSKGGRDKLTRFSPSALFAQKLLPAMIQAE